MSQTAIKIMEVGPRDGLQNEKTLIDTATKLDYIQKLGEAGLKFIEVTSFVSPKAIPQLSDAMELVKALPLNPRIHYSALVPNLKGLERAMEANIRNIAVFTAASNTFTQRNINMSIEESLAGFAPVVQKAQAEGMTVRGYISTAFYCPYEGKIEAERVLEVCQHLFMLGVEELSLGDTIGQAVPDDVDCTLKLILPHLPVDKLAMHFHDTNGLAIENVEASLAHGIRIFDASAGGLGGCPYAPGASGNVSTESVVAFLHQKGYQTGVDLPRLKAASAVILKVLENTADFTEDIGNLQNLSVTPYVEQNGL